MQERASHRKMGEWWVRRYSRQREKLLQKSACGKEFDLLEQWSSNFSMFQHHLQRLVKTQDFWVPPPDLLIQLSQAWNPKICISNKFPGDADVTHPGVTLWEPLHQRNRKKASVAIVIIVGGTVLLSKIREEKQIYMSPQKSKFHSEIGSSLW